MSEWPPRGPWGKLSRGPWGMAHRVLLRWRQPSNGTPRQLDRIRPVMPNPPPWTVMQVYEYSSACDGLMDLLLCCASDMSGECSSFFPSRDCPVQSVVSNRLTWMSPSYVVHGNHHATSCHHRPIASEVSDYPKMATEHRSQACHRAV